jgi:hypothetical protein
MGRQQLPHVILTTWDAEIGRITVPVKPQQKALRTPSQQKKSGCGGVCSHPAITGSIE